MARRLEAGDGFHTTQYHEPGFGLGRVGLRGLGSDIAWNDDRTRCAVVEGELYDTGPLRAMLLGAGRHADSDNQAELILGVHERCGLEFLLRLNGAFAVAIWDRSARALTVFNDRLGLFPIYYARPNGALLFGSGVRALLADPAVSRRVDLLSINEFLVFDHVLHDRTFLESVRLLPQASVLTFRDGQLVIRPYWTLRYPTVYRRQRDEEYIEQFMHYLRQAVARQQPGRQSAAVLLSGGLDSRLLLAPLREAGVPVHGFTFGIPGCDDARVAAEVASALDTEHHFFELKPDWLLEFAAEAVRRTDGLGNIVNLHAMATLEEECRHTQILYKGFLGDALFGFALKRQMWGDYEGTDRYDTHLDIHAALDLVLYDRAQQRRLFSDAFRAEVGDSVHRAYREGLDKASASQLANERLYFDLTQRIPRHTLNGVEVVRNRAIARLPFADNDLLDFALTVPPGYLFERWLSRMALETYYPRLARIPLAGTGRTVGACARDVVAQARGLLSWHLQQRGLGWLGGPSRRPYKDYSHWFRTTLRSWMEDLLLDRRTLERGYFNPDFIRQLVSEHVAGANHATRLGGLLTVELWHRQFVD